MEKPQQQWASIGGLEDIHRRTRPTTSSPEVPRRANPWRSATASSAACGGLRLAPSDKAPIARGLRWMDDIHFAPKKPWDTGCPVNTNKQWFPVDSIWCRISSIHSITYQVVKFGDYILSLHSAPESRKPRDGSFTAKGNSPWR